MRAAMADPGSAGLEGRIQGGGASNEISTLRRGGETAVLRALAGEGDAKMGGKIMGELVLGLVADAAAIVRSR
jgi:hypothetical protein